MSVRSRKRLRDDTLMADLSAKNCLEAHRKGKIFTLELPTGLPLGLWVLFVKAHRFVKEPA